jgi:uncharacterized protein with HEPN domain
MNERIIKWAYDITDAIEEIESYFDTDNRDFNSFLKDKKTIRAVERNLEIIGEALNRIKKENPEIAFENTQRIIATRNKIAHEYDKIDEGILWSIIWNHLPLLKNEVINFIS